MSDKPLFLMINGATVAWMAQNRGVAEVPAAVAQDEPVGAHGGSGLHHVQEEIGAGEEGPVQQPIGARTGCPRVSSWALKCRIFRWMSRNLETDDPAGIANLAT
jgi:hypothetical protein